MNSDSKNYWIQQGLEKVKDSAKKIEEISKQETGLWKSIITIHATILGISMPLMSFTGATINFSLILTWTFQIICLALGLLLLKFRIDINQDNCTRSLRFFQDIYDILDRQERGEFLQDKYKKTGLIAAAVDNLYWRKRQGEWPQEKRELAEKYKNELYTAKFSKEHTETLSGRVKNLLLKKEPILIFVFYCLSAIPFITLLLATLTQ